MTEQELRQSVVSAAVGWLGRKESDGSHREIIDLYNSHKPLARGYAVKYTDAWCATFASAAAIKAGLADIIPTECGCEEQIKLFKALGSWVEDDAYIPSFGDYIFYDWDDNGVGDCTGRADHVGIVTACDGKTVTVIEGNKNNAVGYRTLAVNGRYIRGYGVPNYASKATKEETGMRLYKTLKDVPEDYRGTIQKLMEKKALGGYSDPDPERLDDNELNLSEDFCRIMVVLDRLGVLGV